MEPSLISKLDTHKLTVEQLKRELRSRNAKLSGNKAELEARLRDLLTRSPALTETQTLQLLAQAPPAPIGFQPPITQLGQRQVHFPVVPTVEPGVPVKAVPKFRPPTGPASAKRMGIPEQEAPLTPEITKIIDTYTMLLNNQLTTEQQITELTSAGLVTKGTPEVIKARLNAYLNAFRLTKPSRFPLCTVDTSTGGDIGFIFDLFWKNTTEQIVNGLRSGDWISFYDNNAHSYHSIQVANITRSSFGLAKEIQLNFPGFSLRKIKGLWQMINQTTATPIFIPGPIAAHLKMI